VAIWGSRGGEDVDVFLGRNRCVGLQVDTVSEEHNVSIFRTENVGSTFLQNVGIYVQVDKAFQPRIPISAYASVAWYELVL
jgi:hypothetical protein